MFRPDTTIRPAVSGRLKFGLVALAAGWLCGLLGCAGLGAGGPEQTSAPAGLLLSGTHQLTFAGRRSGEGYFARDDSALIFQSERQPENPFFQIYTLDLRSGQSRRLSSGRGKTTCGFFHPSGGQALFASTHLDPKALDKQRAELESRAAGHERRYAWDYDPHFDLFAVTLRERETAAPRRLTDSPGYDAEASWSPDGRWIVFASNRHAYAKGAGVDAAQLERDPASFIDLYVMDSNGRNVRRLTDTPGYDGGPFFSPDGSRIAWRRFTPDGARAEIHTMRVDGTDDRAITDLGVMSWAPFYHPSGDYLIFTTSLHGHDDFELYIVDVEGAHAPVRVTESAGFDGLPAFSSDGRRLVWTSNRTPDRSSQLFRADWDDALARSLLGLPDPAGAVVAPILPIPEQTEPAISEVDLRAYVEALSSDTTEGRLTGTRGERIATSYVARVFRSIGLEPAGEDGGYFQPFGFTAGVSLGPDNRLRIETPAAGASPPLVVDQDWRPFAFSSEGEIPVASVVYAGYGIVAPASDGQRAIDSYAGLDVKDRWVLVFRYMPEGLSPESRQHLHLYSSLRHKAMVARDRGARGLLVASGPNSKVREQLAELRFDVSLAGSGIAAVSLTDAVADALVAPAGHTIAALQDKADADSSSRGFPLPDVRVGATISLETLRQTGRNVLGRLQVGAEPSPTVVIVGAHVDHLGRGDGSGSLARPDEQGMIHPGADDNASGVAAVIEMAQWLSTALQEGELDARRDIVFAAWSGEELGLLGSSHYVDGLAGRSANPHAPLSDRVVAYLNLDMVGRQRDSLSLFGVGSSTHWPALIEQENVPVGLAISPQSDSYLPTDATAFYARRVPILSAFTGTHAEYHSPRDTADKLNYGGLRDIARLMGGVTREIATADQVPDYLATAPDRQGQAGPGAIRVFLGTIPDYAQSDAVGVVISGVSPGGPADVAGLRAGDTIVEVAGRAIENIYDYTFALDALAVGEPTPITVVRSGKRVTLIATPTSRD